MFQLAAFILQQGSVDLADTLRPLSAAENTSLLLEVLTVIPEEVSKNLHCIKWYTNLMNVFIFVFKV